MATTQTDLHQFFKAKKCARITNPAKSATKSGTHEKSTTTVKPVEKDVIGTPPVTPKRKWDADENAKSKKRRQAEETVEQNTPDGAVRPDVRNLQRSARKRLIMESEVENVSTDEETEREKEKDLGASPTKQRKKSLTNLTPEEIKNHLGKCSRLDELRAKLIKVNQCSEKLRKFKERTIADVRTIEPRSPCKGVAPLQLQKFKELHVEVLVSPKKTPTKTPIKTPSKAPAYERYQHLVEKPSEELVLPFKYRVIKEVFKAVDTVVSLLHNRQEIITYSKLKPAVQEMLRRTMNEKHLGQIKSVFPLAYIFKQECKKNIRVVGPANGARQPYELTISANLDYMPATQNLSSKFDSVSQPQTPRFRKMDSIVMVERRNIFHNSLVDILRDYHDHFLQSLDPPIMSSGLSIKRWHPDFQLEDMPDIDPEPLPQPPVTEKLDTARDVLDKAQDLLSVNPRMERAVVEAAAKIPAKAEPPPAPATQPTNICAALKGVSSSLLEKIRAREAAKTAREMTRSSSENKELEMLSRLPEIAQIVRNIFVTEKKAALTWEMVAAKVSSSYPSTLRGSTIDSHLHLLIKEVPGWCTVHKVRNGTFLKIKKNEEMSTVTSKLEAVIKQRK